MNRACFSKEQTPEFTKMGESHELFVLALSLVWFAGAAPDVCVKSLCAFLLPDSLPSLDETHLPLPGGPLPQGRSLDLSPETRRSARPRGCQHRLTEASMYINAHGSTPTPVFSDFAGRNSGPCSKQKLRPKLRSRQTLSVFTRERRNSDHGLSCWEGTTQTMV